MVSGGLNVGGLNEMHQGGFTFESWDSFSGLRQHLLCPYESVASLGVRTVAVECNPVVVESCIQMEGVGWDWIGWGWDVVWCRVGWDGVGWGSCDWLRLVATGCNWLRMVEDGMWCGGGEMGWGGMGWGGMGWIMHHMGCATHP